MTSVDGNIEADKAGKNILLFLDLLDSPQDLLQSILLAPSPSNKEHQKKVESLKLISKELFSRVERFAALYEKIDSKEESYASIDDSEGELCPLSGLSKLYTGPTEEEDLDEDMTVDADTVFNQVDLQNASLMNQMKKIMKKLKKNIANEGSNNIDGPIRLLNMDGMNSEEEDGEDGTKNDSSDDGKEIDSGDSTGENEGYAEDDSMSNDEDEETKRIRARMERSMAAMEDDIDETESEEEKQESVNHIRKDSQMQDKDDAIDPSREDLYDGFFDLHEMENFADEEEEMLPDEAFGEPEEENSDSLEQRRKMLPHAIARQGGEDDDDEDDDDFNFLEKKIENTIRRKKYRDDEDIKALTGMYGDTNDEPDEEDEEEDDVINMTAADLFGPPKKPSKSFLEKSKKEDKQVTFADDDSWDNHDFTEDGKNWRETEMKDDDKDDNDKESEANESEKEEEMQLSNKLSNYAERSNKLDTMTKQLEKDMLAEKPWQMVGEAKGTQRPTNSLLEVTPTFEFATKMAPIITAEHTESIEDMIKRRILAEDWDDVVPRELPDIGLSKRKGELPEVSQEKSKLSLGELYEREYLKKVAGYDADAVEKETEEEKAQNEMKMLFANLCSKLDALSNYHFAPRPVADEAEIKTSSTPAVAMEEVLPLHVSDAQAMAPEEVYAKKKGRDGILRGETEMDQVRFILISRCDKVFISDFLLKIKLLLCDRTIENDCVSPRRLLEERPEKLSLLTRNSFLDSNLNLDSIIHTRRERCVKSCKWHEQVESWFLEKLIKTLISKPALSFFRRCNLMYKCLSSRMTLQVRREKGTTRHRSQAHLNCSKPTLQEDLIILSTLGLRTFSSFSDFCFWTFHFFPANRSHYFPTTCTNGS